MSPLGKRKPSPTAVKPKADSIQGLEDSLILKLVGKRAAKVGNEAGRPRQSSRAAQQGKDPTRNSPGLQLLLRPARTSGIRI